MRPSRFLITSLVLPLASFARPCATLGARPLFVRPSTSSGLPSLSKSPSSNSPLRVRGGASLASMASSPTLVTPEWLRDNLASCKVLDCSWYLLPQMAPRDAHKEFEAKRIPSSLFFDIDVISDKSSDLPHMMPSSSDFSSHCQRLGISRSSHVIVYDGKGQFSSARAWKMFKAFGHDKVSILDGGFPAWEALGAPVDTSAAQVTDGAAAKGDYSCDMVPGTVVSMQQVEDMIRAKSHQILDARPRPRFEGAAPEPRPGIESGHIAGTVCVPWGEVLTPAGAFKTEDELRKLMQDNSVDVTKPCAVTCGSGVSACIVAVALDVLGNKDVPLFDGAYCEWKTAGKETVKGPATSNL
mmetsp:Transcript_18809/g.47417  ORF Transcript_18809/g.47417 Transcript_18809/m.47417 type:complete len:355 (+) Transcript_18809:10-1074(+)